MPDVADRCPPPAAGWGAVLEAFVVAVVSAALLGWLALSVFPSFFKTDGPDLLWAYWEVELGRELAAQSGGALPEPAANALTHEWHVGALRIFDWFRSLVPDLSLVEAWKLLCATGVGLAIGCVHLGTRWCGASRRLAWWATGLFATTPSVILFASVVEVHGAAIGCAGLGFLGTAVLVRWGHRPWTWAWLVSLAAFYHLGFASHSTGLLWPLLWVGLWWALRLGGENGVGFARRDLIQALVLAALHGGLFAVLPKLLPAYYGAYANLDAARAIAAENARPTSLAYAPEVLWQEWLMPLAPLAWIVLIVPFCRGLRLGFVSWLLGLVPLWLVTTTLLVFEPEYGAYLIPALIPAAYWTAGAAERMPRGGVLVAVVCVLSAALGIWRTADVDAWPGPWRPDGERPVVHRADYERMAAAFAELGGAEQAFVLVAEPEEMAAAMVAIGPHNFFWVVRQAEISPERFQDSGMIVLGYLQILRQRGLEIYITERAWNDLERPMHVNPAMPDAPPMPRSGPLLRRALASAFRVEPVTAAGVSFQRLAPR